MAAEKNLNRHGALPKVTHSGENSLFGSFLFFDNNWHNADYGKDFGSLKVGNDLSNNINTLRKLEMPVSKNDLKKRIYKYRYFYLMFLPVFAMLTVFNYIPMLGIRFAFTKYGPFAPPRYIGWANFADLFRNPRFMSAFGNTLFLSLINLALGTVVAILFALLLNELCNKYFKSFVQTVLYLPHFISWIVVASIFYLILSPSDGFINNILGLFGQKPIYFMVSPKWWTPIFIFANRWKDTGWSTIIYLAALCGINAELYEAAAMDGAGRLKQIWHVTLPGIANTILVVFILNLSGVLNIFESVFAMQNPMVVDVAEVIETYVYKVGLLNSDYGYSTAVGLFKSLITLGLVLMANQISKRVKGVGII